MSIGRSPYISGPKRGDVYFVAFKDIGGNVLHGQHPAVIVQTDRMASSSTVVIVPMTSAPRSADFEPPYLVRVKAKETGLQKDGWIKCDQPMTYPAAELGQRAGRVAPDRLAEVDRALRFVLGLGESG